MKGILNKRKKKKGFTLIELIIVLAVMSIIAAIAIPNFNAVRDNSKVKADNQSKETIKRTVLMLVADETVKVSANTTIKFNAGGGSYNVDAVANITGLDKLKEALSQVKAPQTSSVKAYQIVVGTDGTVTVTTINETITDNTTSSSGSSGTGGGTGSGS